MAIRNDFTIDWGVSPRIITIAAPSTACSMQDLIDTLRFKEAEPEAMDNPPIVDASGKEVLDTTNKVGLTVTLQNAKIGFEARPGPDWLQCLLDGGNVVAIDVDGVPIDEVANNAFVNVKTTKSASATLQEQDALQYASYGGVVTVDSINGSAGIAYPIGTIEFPTKYASDAVLICKEKGFNAISVIGNLDLVAGDDIRGLKIIGTSHINSLLDVGFDALCEQTLFCCFEISGFLDGGNQIDDCVVKDLIYFNGSITNSALAGRITLAGTKKANFINCHMDEFGNTPILDCGGFGQDAIFSQYSARIIIENLTGSATIGVGLSSGGVIIDSTCTAGKIICNGNGSVDSSAKGANCNLIDRLVSGREIKNIQRQVAYIAPHHTASGDMYFWDPYGGNDAWDGKDTITAFKTFAKAQDACQNAQ